MNEVKLKLAALMMQKNETELLEKWIIYHADLFGIDNLYIFDNGSDDKQTIEILRHWESQGIRVIWEYLSKQDFESKGTILGDRIKMLETSHHYDCFIPLDCDEFLAVRLSNGAISCEATDICDEIKRHAGSEDILLIDAQFFNSPISEQWFHRFENRKCFFMKGTFKSMDVGFHWGKTKNSEKEVKTNLVQFHFHYKPFAIAREYARNKLALRVKSFDKDYLSNYKGAGEHLVKYFLLSEKQYLKNVLSVPHFYINVLSEKFASLGIEWPYFHEMKDSFSVLTPNADFNQKDIVRKLHNVADHRFRGSIDQIVCVGENIRIDGWCAEMNTLPICHFALEGAKGEQYLVTGESVLRPDIASLLGFDDRKFGFAITVPIEVLHSLGISELILFPKLQSGEMGPALSINKKYQNFISDVLS
ncbi:glycosyltransferase family 2 protein [Paraglaciecola sp. L3A3]|uniref:glycosyltransferase family 2 protein n=1 Tax=Paraglaciecola sp. L3A3 TaxID=2686358 RepID=UPI00131DB957|nr:glycosyltransferase family 2 protein [Paraglaciecola sp. L3A3]